MFKGRVRGGEGGMQSRGVGFWDREVLLAGFLRSVGLRVTDKRRFLIGTSIPHGFPTIGTSHPVWGYIIYIPNGVWRWGAPAAAGEGGHNHSAL